MKTENHTSTTTSTPKDSPVTVETFEDVLKLMGVESLDIREETKAGAVAYAPRLLERHGPEWFKEHSLRLTQELELLDTF